MRQAAALSNRQLCINIKCYGLPVRLPRSMPARPGVPACQPLLAMGLWAGEHTCVM